MAPTLVFIVGPPAVGKMTVGAALAARTGLKLFHNHRTIDLVLPFFAFGSPPFDRLISEFRRRTMEEVASSDLPGLIFTYVWAFDQPRDDADVEAYSAIFKQRGGAVFYVELQASQAVRLQRNETEFRLAEKPFKRDLVESRRNLISSMTISWTRAAVSRGEPTTCVSTIPISRLRMSRTRSSEPSNSTNKGERCRSIYRGSTTRPRPGRS
jgi:hypothetical protein